MKELYKISVIVPIYNVEKYILDCIASIRGQSYKNLEIILVDDGSEDQSGEICDKEARTDNRIKVIHKRNGGLVSARKAGLAAASGDYIGFVDGDDYIEPSFYEVLLKGIVTTKSDFVHTGYIEERRYGEKRVRQFASQVIYNNSDVCLRLIENGLFGERSNRVLTPSIWSKLFRGDFIKKCYVKVPDDHSQGEDAICLAISLLNAEVIGVQNETMYHYRKREASYTDYRSVQDIESIWKQYTEFKKIFTEAGIYPKLEDVMDQFYLHFALRAQNKMNLKYDIHIYHFEKMEMLKGKRIILYGAGKVGQDLYAQICKYDFCEIVAWVDKRYEEYQFDYRKVESPKNLSRYQYDYILISVIDKQMAMSIWKDLENSNILVDKILWDEDFITE